MNTANLYRKLFEDGFTRVERDDRLLDVFPAEISEKGVELWEKWGNRDIYLVRIHLPLRPKFVRLYKLKREKIESALQANMVGKLGKYKPITQSVAEILQFGF